MVSDDPCAYHTNSPITSYQWVGLLGYIDLTSSLSLCITNQYINPTPTTLMVVHLYTPQLLGHACMHTNWSWAHSHNHLPVSFPLQVNYYNGKGALQREIAADVFNSDAVGMLELYSTMLFALQNSTVEQGFPALFATVMKRTAMHACRWVSPCNFNLNWTLTNVLSSSSTVSFIRLNFHWIRHWLHRQLSSDAPRIIPEAQTNAGHHLCISARLWLYDWWHLQKSVAGGERPLIHWSAWAVELAMNYTKSQHVQITNRSLITFETITT